MTSVFSDTDSSYFVGHAGLLLDRATFLPAAPHQQPCGGMMFISRCQDLEQSRKIVFVPPSAAKLREVTDRNRCAEVFLISSAVRR